MTHFADMIEGYRRFRNGGWQEQRDRWNELAEGQSPKVMVIACSDSRVDPETIFSAMPGELFVEYQLAAKKMRPSLMVSAPGSPLDFSQLR